MLAAPLLDHPIRPCQDGRRDREPKRLRGLRIDHELELGRLLDGDVAGLRASEYFVDEERLTPIGLKNIYPIGYEATVDDKLLNVVDRGEPVLERKVKGRLTVLPHEWGIDDHEGLVSILSYFEECCGKLGGIVNDERAKRNALSARCGRGQFSIPSPDLGDRCPRDIIPKPGDL